MSLFYELDQNRLKNDIFLHHYSYQIINNITIFYAL